MMDRRAASSKLLFVARLWLSPSLAMLAAAPDPLSSPLVRRKKSVFCPRQHSTTGDCLGMVQL